MFVCVYLYACAFGLSRASSCWKAFIISQNYFKFTHGWENRFRADLSTGTRTAWCRARHKAYLRNLTLREGTPSVGQEQVTRYVGSQQLLDLGIINSPQTFIEWEGATK